MRIATRTLHMDSKFRSTDDRPPQRRPPPTPWQPEPLPFSSPYQSRGYFPDQPFRVNYRWLEPPMMTWQLERARIRDEMRREIEAEVRREIMIEREMGIQFVGCGGNVPFEQRWTMQLPMRRFSRFTSHQLDYRPDQGHRCDRSPNNARLFSSSIEATSVPGVMRGREDKKNKIILLAKPDPNLCGAKRKAETSHEPEELPVAGIKKKPKVEWACALCQVSCTCEKGLNEHLQGKKHKAKEAALRDKNIAKNLNNLSLPDKQYKKSQKTRQAKVQKREETLDSKKKKFKFWCEVCQIGVNGEVVMETHKKGKKHLLRSLAVENGETIPAITNMLPSEEKHEEEVIALEVNKENAVIVSNSRNNTDDDSEDMTEDADEVGTYFGQMNEEEDEEMSAGDENNAEAATEHFETNKKGTENDEMIPPENCDQTTDSFDFDDEEEHEETIKDA